MAAAEGPRLPALLRPPRDSAVLRPVSSSRQGLSGSCPRGPHMPHLWNGTETPVPEPLGSGSPRAETRGPSCCRAPDTSSPCCQC